MGSSVIAIKTHTNSPGAAQIQRYDAAVYIVRNPWDVLVANWNRKRAAKSSEKNGTRHTISVGMEYFGK